MIDKDKKYSISEVSKITGYEPHVLRYYESDFNLQIPRTNSNRRYYTYKEIERFIYIKELQNKGLTNKQIKLILESPELIVSATDEIAVTREVAISNSNDLTILEKNSPSDIINGICSNINCKLEQTKEEIISYLDATIKGKEQFESNDTVKKEKDVLICENARLKMKLKEKSYEVAKLKEKLNRLDQKKISFWKKFFLKKT
ncbi:MerR family transcriptional regulator [Crassaminicella thermophila]|uniref:MerR family transcriptional regulator n=1 Tax=Crassaminicella thermophila TaxID=2599308 RepID=A0A5C0SFW8_CRATE|nr:MerR family transcriptional regulator [Crassaminicella thermophila]QEK12178.1 MerR family transcriptional regulator [Crassaminicella thermophila]